MGMGIEIQSPRQPWIRPMAGHLRVVTGSSQLVEHLTPRENSQKFTPVLAVGLLYCVRCFRLCFGCFGAVFYRVISTALVAMWSRESEKRNVYLQKSLFAKRKLQIIRFAFKAE